MEIILMAQWLNTQFAGFDYAILEFYHKIAEATGYKITWLFRAITSTAEHGYGMIALSLLMILIPLIPALKKKYPSQCQAVFRCGCVAITAIILGALFTNVLIKENVARPRPYTYEGSQFYEWWLAAKGNIDHEFSFPSGHTTCTMAVMTAIFLCGNRKKSWLAFIYVILMGATRNYFMMHYPTDIIGGIFVGGLSAIMAYLFFKHLVFKPLEKKRK